MKVVAKNVMIKDVISVKENYSLFQLEELFFNENISGAPVIDDEGQLIGIVSKTDIICNELEHELQTIMSSFVSLFSDEISMELELKDVNRMGHHLVCITYRVIK